MCEVGKVYLVGAGPGDPTLLTKRAEYLIGQADIVFYDRLVHPFIVQIAPPHSELVSVGKMPYNNHITQEEIHELFINSAKEGKTVVRLKGGDPAIFGRVKEEVEALDTHGISWEIIPGITASSAAASSLGIGLTGRNVSTNVTLTTGHFKPESHDKSNIQTLLDGGTIAIYMGVKKIDGIMRQIQDETLEDYPVAVLINATLYSEELVIGKVSDIAEKLISAMNNYQPAIIIIGKVIDDITYPLPNSVSKTLINGRHEAAVRTAFLKYHSKEVAYIQPIDTMSESYAAYVNQLIDQHIFDEKISIQS
ncbi:uroporphyrinogen-III C-methyltransferase [Staphylococcus cohnii]|uniref:uroporphyrinogen-III C-methyltransferase n=1 Tax=Staphylococcaceae TaxID=90964 RepID=UPI001F47E5BD|nr:MULTISPECIES: uroporphyrinogen-III C-methyltransferase [Staphylococcaceae]MCE5035091.1 uroporphyrinogen-III C-methyltransferase [Staphylococcus cohnii]